MMAFRNSDEIDNKIKDIVSKKVKGALDKSITQEYVEELRDRIVNRTRLGNGIDPETGSTQRLKKLADITKRVRKNEARVFGVKGGGKIVWTDGTEDPDLTREQKKIRKESFKAFFGNVNLASTTTPAKSNLTATGQLLKSLTVVKVKIEGGVQYIIRVADRRGRDMFGNSSKIGNKQLVEYLEAQGRSFLGFTTPQRNQIKREIKDFIVKYINNS